MPWVGGVGGRRQHLNFKSFCDPECDGQPQIPPSHLHLERPPLDLRDALGDDEGDAVAGAAGHLGEVPAEQLEATLQLLVAALDGQSLQTALVTGQEALRCGGGRAEEKAVT